MNFFVVPYSERNTFAVPGTYPCVLLIDDGWDDYDYRTLYHARLYNAPRGGYVSLGDVKILQGGEQSSAVTSLPRTFYELDPRTYCSLGQTLQYYRNLANQSPNITEEYLRRLNDVAGNTAAPLRQEDGFKTSLLRYAEARSADRNARALLKGMDIPAGSCEFTFATRLPNATGDHVMPFQFSGTSPLPSRISVLIGRNGTGKTQCLANLALALSGVKRDAGHFTPTSPPFSRVLAVSYNPFDKFQTPRDDSVRDVGNVYIENEEFSYKYCGLRRRDSLIDPLNLLPLSDPGMMRIRSQQREEYLISDLTQILNDSITAREFANDADQRARIYSDMSAGQRILTSVLCNVLSFAVEESLILIDEPETHLHPGLLSTLMVMLTRLLTSMNSFAILATHSPQILQQVPAASVLIFRRHDNRPSVKGIQCESFGQSLDALTEEVLAVIRPESDYRSILAELAKTRTFEDVMGLFGGRLALPAQIHLRSLYQSDDG